MEEDLIIVIFFFLLLLHILLLLRYPLGPLLALVVVDNMLFFLTIRTKTLYSPASRVNLLL